MFPPLFLASYMMIGISKVSEVGVGANTCSPDRTKLRMH